MKHLISIEDIKADHIYDLFERATTFLHQAKTDHRTRCYGKTVVNLFFEPSTRTRVSFELAAKRLGMDVINLGIDDSSLQKGESLQDTLLTLQAMQSDYIIIRHTNEGVAAELAAYSGEHGPSIINAGDGIQNHPTQALLDLLTIYQSKTTFAGLRVAIVGDSQHSRVARSLVAGLSLLEVNDIRLVGPEKLLLNDDRYKLTTHVDFKSGLHAADVVVVLRVQKERMQQADCPDFKEYYAQYGLNAERMAWAQRDAILLHPGPVNREVEISSELLYGRQSKILAQVANGVAMRMAVLS